MSVPEVGDQAPDFTLRDEKNEKWTLSGHRGKNILLVFYPLSFSGVCTHELHEITNRADKFAATNAEVVGISVDSKYVQSAFKRDEGLSAALLADFNPRGEVARKYGVYMDEWGYANRGSFVIDKDGRIAHKIVTSPSDARDPDAYGGPGRLPDVG
jgi:peroxiredoxin